MTSAEFRAAYAVARKYAMAAVRARMAGEPPPVPDQRVLAAQKVLSEVPAEIRDRATGATDKLLRQLDAIVQRLRDRDSDR